MSQLTNMAVRKIWIHGNIGDVDSGVVFSKLFPTQERYAKKCLGADYVPIPSDEEFSALILTALGIRKRFPDFVSSRDSTSKITQLPIVDVETKNGKLWPLVVIEHNGSLLCCLPNVEKVFKSKDTFDDLFNNPSITIGIALLEAISSIILNSLVSAKIKDIETFINISLPFGRPTDLDPSNVFSLLTLSPEKMVVEEQIKLSQSPKGVTLGKGKSTVTFGIQESVRCVMWDQARVGATAQVYGSVLVKAELEGNQTDVSVAMSYDTKEKPVLVGNLIFHPCVHNSSLSSMGEVLSDKSPKKIKFTPQLKKFAVCKYAANLTKPPIEGEYKMKGKDKVELSLKLTLSESIVKRKFSYFEARFPFFNRGKIRKVECKPSWGLVHLTDDKRTLVWNIGQNFQGKGVHLSLAATIHFVPAEEVNNHPFCRENNSYVQLEFLIANYTLSGCYIDLKTIQISPPYKTKLETGRELRATDYKIWNCHGDIPFYAPDNIAAVEVTE